MKDEKDYIQDIAEIRSMMERSSKFLSLSGWAGILVGIYALAGAFVAYQGFGFNPQNILASPETSEMSPETIQISLLGLGILTLALVTAVYISYREAIKRGEKLWNPTSRRLALNMSIPFVAGGILILVLLSKGLLGLAAPLSLIFYGLALYNAAKYTYKEVRTLGIVQICLGLISSYYIACGLLIWAIGFGLVHIVYGVYMHYRYEK